MDNRNILHNSHGMVSYERYNGQYQDALAGLHRVCTPRRHIHHELSQDQMAHQERSSGPIEDTGKKRPDYFAHRHQHSFLSSLICLLCALVLVGSF